jgi:hypothetical protein
MARCPLCSAGAKSIPYSTDHRAMQHIVCPNCLAYEISEEVITGLFEERLFTERTSLSKAAFSACEAGRPPRLSEMDDVRIALIALGVRETEDK